MSFDVVVTEPFERKVKKLAKRHKSLGSDLASIIDQLPLNLLLLVTIVLKFD